MSEYPSGYRLDIDDKEMGNGIFIIGFIVCLILITFFVVWLTIRLW